MSGDGSAIMISRLIRAGHRPGSQIVASFTCTAKHSIQRQTGEMAAFCALPLERACAMSDRVGAYQ